MKIYVFILRTCLLLLLISPFARGEIQADASGLFRQICSNLAAEAGKSGSISIAGRDNWFFLSSELRHLGAGQFWGGAASGASRAAKPEAADPLPAILDFNDQLKKAGVELVIVPVPPKAVVYPEMLPGFTNRNETARLDSSLREFYGILKSKNVRVLDLTDIFIREKNDSRGPLYCRQDSHWSGNGCVLAAVKISSEIRALIGDAAGGKQSFTGSWQTVEISGDLRPELKGAELPREKLNIRKISRPGSGEPVTSGAGSRVILLGDSHSLVFHAGDDMLSSGAGLPDQLAFELGEEVELVAVRGSGATPARVNLMRRAQQKQDYWKQKKCVIWCFSAREFTESEGWRKVPVVMQKAD